MGAKNSSSKCTTTAIDYVRRKDFNKLTRQLSKQPSVKRHRTDAKECEQTHVQLLQLDSDHDEQQRSALHFAAIESDAAIIVVLYEYMHTVDVADATGRTPLHYAAIVGNEETLTTLLLCNPDLYRISKDGTSALHEAIIHNHANIVTSLIQHNANVDELFQAYLPPLILAVYLQHRNIVEILMRVGVDPNLADTRMGRSALHYAAYFHDNTSIFHLLLSSNIYRTADINAQDDNGFSVLDYARLNVRGSTAIADLLLQLHVYDPYRGEHPTEDIQIEVPQIKVFRLSDELSSLKTSDKKKSKKTKARKIFSWKQKSK